MDPVGCTLAHVDAATERLIIEKPLVSQDDLETVEGKFVFCLLTQPGDAHYIRAFRVENVQRSQADSAPLRVWMVLRPSGRWQRIDRRRAERVELQHTIVDGRRYPVSGGMLQFRGSLSDISEGGVLLVTDQHVQLSDVLEFELPFDPPIRARARVLRVQGGRTVEPPMWQAGCIFEGLTGDASTRISDYVARQSAAGAMNRPGQNA